MAFFLEAILNVYLEQVKIRPLVLCDPNRHTQLYERRIILGCGNPSSVRAAQFIAQAGWDVFNVGCTLLLLDTAERERAGHVRELKGVKVGTEVGNSTTRTTTYILRMKC